MRWIVTLTFTSAILLLAACGPRRAEVEPPRPTITPVPTFTSTPVGATAPDTSGQTNVQVQPPAQTPLTATDAPVSPTETPAPQVPMVTIGNTIMNVRAGPGTNYPVVGTAAPDEQFPITGKNPGLGDWWEIDYRGRTGWIYGPLVTATNAAGVAVASFIPAAPPPTATPIPSPTPVPAPTQPPAPQYPFSLASQGQCRRHDRVTTFKGIVCQRGGNPQEGCAQFNSQPKNDVCVHVAFSGPKNTKCSGCSEPYGVWGFTPFGVAPEGQSLHDKVRGITVEIFVVPCPAELQADKRGNNIFTSKDFSNLAPQSQKWTKTLNESMECTGITFKEN